MDILLVGLGNPGKEHHDNRHNVGFMVLDAIAEKYNLPNYKQRFQGQVTQAEIGSKKVLLLKPETYMNLSGRSVLSACSFYKIPLEQVIVVHDDLDLILAKIKFKQGGGSGGHNGLKSLDSIVGSGYHRLRFGISHPGDKGRVSDFVLSDFNSEERKIVDATIATIVDNIELLIKDDDVNFLNKIHQGEK